MAKNIVILCDGTGQIGGKNASTNVYKLFNMLEDRTPDQVVFYDPGIGSMMGGILAQIFGIGFKKNVLDCYRFLFENYQAGDNIYLFGFSRGAATVRSLSAFIELFGILPASRRDLIDQAFNIYEMRTDKEHHVHKAHNDPEKEWNERELAATEFVKKHHTMWTRVKFIGVWDTVAALGGSGDLLRMITDKIRPHRFHNFELGPGVDYARHAISIDDERRTFHPIIWEKLKGKHHEADRLKQVWFCGVHTDVGGGYDKLELSYYSLDWMIREAEAKGLRFYKGSKAWEDYQDLKKRDEKDEHDLINGQMHNEQQGLVGSLYKRKVRAWNKEKFGTICIHDSVFRRKKNNANELNPEYQSRSWILKISDYKIEK